MTLRVLHLFANHKVTGPAELALDTARAVEAHATNGAEDRPDGQVESLFMAGRHPRDPFWLGELAASRNARLIDDPGIRLAKHFNPFRAFRDGRALARLVEREAIQLVHCHLPNDHLVASVAVSLLGRARRVPIVRTIYDGEPLRIGWRERRTLGKSCDHVICFSAAVRDGLLATPLGLPRARVSLLDPPIDTSRFDPARRGDLPDGRARLGIAPDAFTAGIVARMQTHRRFEVLIDAIRLVANEIPGFRFVIIGRGTNQVRVAHEPVRQLGLENTVVFAGYLGGEEFVSTLLTMDLKVFLVPGSDGSCRAVREALACGIPVLAARRGMLPEIVEDGATGRVVDDSAENLAGAMIDLARNRAELERMSLAARESAVKRFGYTRYVRALREIYQHLAVAEPGKTR